MLGQEQKQIVVKTTLAVVASTVLSTVLLLGFPAMRMLIPLVIINIISLVIYLVSGVRIDDNSVLINIILSITYILSGALVLLPGIVLNLVLMRKFSLKHKIVSLILYVTAIAIIAILLFPYIQYQVSHQSLKG